MTLNIIDDEFSQSDFPCLFCEWGLVEIFIGNFHSSSFWERIVPTAPFNKWDKRGAFMHINKRTHKHTLSEAIGSLGCRCNSSSGSDRLLESQCVGPGSLNTWVFPAFRQPTQLIIDRNLTEMIIYSGVSYFFWECSRLSNNASWPWPQMTLDEKLWFATKRNKCQPLISCLTVDLWFS